MSTIQTISDTALLTAFYRAQESERPDALFHDPYARILAGKRAEPLTQHLPSGATSGYPIVVRTYLFDHFITRLVQERRIDTVLNLAAGLDTRPYRLELSPLRLWIDVDLPDILAYKQKLLADVTPSCTLENIALDLTHEQPRKDLLAHVNAESQSVLVLTEGLLNYLPEILVQSLACELFSYEHIHWWCTDMATPLLLRILQLVWGRSLRSGNTRFQFAPSNDEQFFRNTGWQLVKRSDPHISHAVNREVAFDQFFRVLSHLPSNYVQRTFRFGDVLLLSSEHEQ